MTEDEAREIVEGLREGATLADLGLQAYLKHEVVLSGGQFRREVMIVLEREP